QGRLAEIDPIVDRKRAPGRGSLDADRVATSAGSNVRRGAGLQIGERAAAEADPELRLPAPVEALDRGLEARLTRGCEDGRDPERETRPDDGPDRGLGAVAT